jgi:uncharacterized integral membrane protein (TIGR02327 family)
MSAWDPLGNSVQLLSVVNICVVLICVGLSWWGLQEFRFDMLLRRPKSAQSKLLLIFLSIALGYQVARFFMDYLQWSTGLRGIF